MGFFSSVNCHVPVKVSFLAETFSTLMAHVTLFSSVNFHVSN